MKIDNLDPKLVKIATPFLAVFLLFNFFWEISYYDYSGADYASIQIEKSRISLTYPTKWRAVPLEGSYRGAKDTYLVIDDLLNYDFLISVGNDLWVKPTENQLTEFITGMSYQCQIEGPVDHTEIDHYPAYIIKANCKDKDAGAVKYVFIVRQHDVVSISLITKAHVFDWYEADFDKIVQSIDIWE